MEFKDVRKKYNELILNTLLLNGVKEVICNDVKEKFFDKIVVKSDGSYIVKNGGISFSSLLFDFHLDYSKVLYYIEEDLFLIHHGGKGKHFSYVFEERLDLYHEIVRILKEHDLWYDVCIISDDRFSITIDYGDWKHDHGYCDFLMNLNGYRFVSKVVTREDGSDCYDAIHTYEVRK